MFGVQKAVEVQLSVMSVLKLPDDILKFIFTYLEPYQLIRVNLSPLLPDVMEKRFCPIPLVCKRFYTTYSDIVCLFCRFGLYTKVLVTTIKCNTCGHLIEKEKGCASIFTLITRRKRRRLRR